MKALRRAAWAGVIASTGGVVLAIKDWIVGPRVADTQLSYPAAAEEVWWTAGLLALVHAGAAAATWAVARSEATQGRREPWLRVAVGAFAVMVPAELAYVPLREAAVDSAGGVIASGSLGAAAVVAGVGLTVAGLTVISEGRWSGWRRVTVLLAGLWPIVVVTPVFVATGWAAWPLVVWQALLTAMAAAVLVEVDSARAAVDAAPEVVAPVR